MNFNFFKNTFYVKILHGFVYKISTIILFILRKIEHCSLYCIYLYRCRSWSALADARFENSNPLFKNCSKIVCKDCHNNVVNISHFKYENIRNLSVQGSIVVLPVFAIKEFCLLPRNVDSIEFDIFPWEIVDNHFFVISHKNPYKL
ncbi:MAG: hypothetical protein CML47_10455 [Rhodobacteraceae bacterium]|nr:MAG: hypothetical protein CML47_10455 [Paracoccaceae bacterium]